MESSVIHRRATAGVSGRVANVHAASSFRALGPSLAGCCGRTACKRDSPLPCSPALCAARLPPCSHADPSMLSSAAGPSLAASAQPSSMALVCTRMATLRRCSNIPHQLRVMLAMAVVTPPSLADLLGNQVFMAGLLAWFGAQFGKIFTERYKRGYWDPWAFTKPGGTPSSHSSLCAAVTSAVAMVEGLGSPLFAAALAFTAVVMYDAMGVRRHAGMHAQVLNRVVSEMRESSEAMVTDSIDKVEPLKEVLGHTPRQVLCGGLLGVVVGVLYPLSC